jgi:hypothetical protein
MNQIEIWFGVLSRQLLRRGEFRSMWLTIVCQGFQPDWRP